MRPLSESTSRVASRNFSRKYVALGRILSQWCEVMGSEFANKTQPIKISYRKVGRDKKPKTTLEIATTGSYAAILPYQKDLILERINRVFGDQWITDIKFVVKDTCDAPITKKKITPPLTMDEKSFLSGVLEEVDDPEFREKLESLGKAMLTDR